MQLSNLLTFFNIMIYFENYKFTLSNLLIYHIYIILIDKFSVI